VEAAPQTEGVNTTEGRKNVLKTFQEITSWQSMGVGLIPLPVVDIVAEMGNTTRIFDQEDCCEYNVPFSRTWEIYQSRP